MDDFDQQCIEMYGKKTCIIVQHGNKFKMKLLDKSLSDITEIDKSGFYKLIPRMIEYKYTVVIIEEISKYNQSRTKNTKEITAVHLPVQSFLNTPPLLQ